MKNSFFKIKIDETSGGISYISLIGDEHQMNFCKSGRTIGAINGFEVKKIEESTNKRTVFLQNGNLDLTTVYSFDGEQLNVEHILKNTSSCPAYFKDADFAVQMPLNDNYRDGTDVAMKKCCSTHIFCGKNSSYIRAERMGFSDYNLGVVLTKGSFFSYSQECAEIWHSNRGYFILNTPAFHLLSSEEYKISYTFFAYKDYSDFLTKIKNFDSYLHVENDKGYTYKVGETIDFNVLSKSNIKNARANCNGEDIPVNIKENKVNICFKATKYGDNIVNFTVDGKESYARFNVSIDEEKLIETRLNFIIDNQQCLEKNSPLYGAFLIYDNEEKGQFYDANFRDHNACRERFGMAILLIKYLQTHKNKKFSDSLDLFVKFLLRESFEETTGEVFDGIGKDPKFLRLYNAPWVVLIFTEMYNLTKDKIYATYVYKTLKYYYSVGGTKFYPNGIRFYEFFKVLKDAEFNDELDEILKLFDEHVENIVRNGIIYPSHEVVFEQTIVTPAVTLMLDKYEISGDKKYLKEAEMHLKILRKFDGCQPDYHTNNIPIRFWDGRWFGKCYMYGDTFPHYWSTLSGYNYFRYGLLTGDKQAIKVGVQCIRNNTCLFEENGRAHCVYMFPYKVDGKHCEFYDAFANDQDFALYFLWKTVLETK